MDDLISRSAAIDAAIEAVDEWDGGYNLSRADMIDKAINNLPSAEPEHTETHSCDCERTETHDLVSREDAIDAVKQHMNNVSGGNDEYYIAHRHIIELLRIVPTAEPESRREWYMRGYRDAQNAAMHESCTDCPLYDHDRHSCPRFNKVIPTAIRDAQQRWVSVSEALPNDGVEVWVTIKGHDVIRCEEGETLEQAIDRINKIRWVTRGYWSDEEHAWNDPSFGCPLMVQPIAWMPINRPEPWRGGQDE